MLIQQAHVTRTTDRANAAQNNRKNKDVKETQSNYFPRSEFVLFRLTKRWAWLIVCFT
jgi:hypothetical protein